MWLDVEAGRQLVWRWPDLKGQSGQFSGLGHVHHRPKQRNNVPIEAKARINRLPGLGKGGEGGGHLQYSDVLGRPYELESEWQRQVL